MSFLLVTYIFYCVMCLFLCHLSYVISSVFFVMFSFVIWSYLLKTAFLFGLIDTWIEIKSFLKMCRNIHITSCLELYLNTNDKVGHLGHRKRSII